MTLSDLFVTGQLRAMFEFEFGEVAYRQLRVADVILLDDPELEILSTDGFTMTGPYVCQTEVLCEEHGAASGTFRLHFPRGLDLPTPEEVVRDATIEMTIETAPFPLQGQPA